MRNRNRRLPLTAAQMGIWLAQQLDPENPIYRAAEYVDIHGPVDLALLDAALRRAVADTEAMRARFETDRKGAVEQVIEESLDWPLPVVDLRDTTGPAGAADPWERAREWMWADVRRPLDLRRAPLFRCAVLRLPDDHCVLYVSPHHVILDGYGYSLFIQRVAAIYTALEAGEECPPSPQASLAELLDDEAAYLASERFTRDREYWAAQMAGHTAIADLAGQLPAVPHSFIRATGRVPAPTVGGLRRLARQCGSGLPAVAMAALALYVHRMFGNTSVTLDLVVTGRSGSVARRVPSMVANILPLRLELGPDTSVRRLVRHTSERARGLLRHQRYPTLVRDLRGMNLGGDLGDCGINIMGYDPKLSFGRHPAMLHNLSNGPVTGWGVNVYERSADGSLRIDINADPGLYEAEDISAHLRGFLKLLNTLADVDPEQATGGIDLLSADERRQVTTGWNDTARAVPATTLTDLIQAQVQRTPTATALVCGGTTLSYAELNSRANRLAHALIQRGAGPETFVALALPRTAEYIVALLAVLKTGAASVPVDPDLPAERIGFLLADTRPPCVLTTTAIALHLPADAGTLPLDAPATRATLARQPDTDPTDAERLAALSPEHAVYVSYTSGSTGQPQGVVVEHRQLTNLFFDHEAELIAPHAAAAGRRLRAALTASFSFDTAWEGPLFLAAGQELHLIEDAVRLDPPALVDYIAERGIDFLDITPTYLHQLIAAGLFAGERHRPGILMVGGEAIDLRLWETLRAQPGVCAYNYYGPTECTVDAVSCRLSDQSDHRVIGRPGHNIQAYVLDASLNPVPPGVPGELFLAGDQLARGYLNQPALTAERFVRDPFTPGSRMYRTGDRVRWRPEGTLDYLGRIDGQLNIRGFRIEPGEIETVLAQHPGVTHAVVTMREDTPGDQRLIAYVVPASPAFVPPGVRAASHPVPGPRAAGSATPGPDRVDAVALRDWAAARLPEYMIPSAFVLLHELPLTANGKLNRAALPTPLPAKAPDGRPPSTPREKVLCGLFAEVLGTPQVGVDDNFFTLGGHSLLATKLVSRIRAATGTELSIRALYESPTVADLVRLVETDSRSDGFNMLLPLRAHGSRPPLFCVHPSGGLSWCYSGLLAHLEPDRPVYGLQARGLTPGGTLPATFEEMVADYIEQIRTVQGTGPYHLLGWSFGGALAHAIAVRLQDRREQVALLSMLDAFPMGPRETTGAIPHEHEILAAVLQAAGHDPLASLREHPALGERPLTAVTEVCTHFLTKLLPTVVQGVFDGDLLYFHATEGKPADAPSSQAWRPLVTGRIEHHDVPCTHSAMTQTAALARIGRHLTAYLDAAHAR